MRVFLGTPIYVSSDKLYAYLINTISFSVISPFYINSSPGKPCSKCCKNQVVSFFKFIFKIPKAEWESARTGIPVSFDIDHDFFGRNFQALCYSSNNTLISLMRNYPVDIVLPDRCSAFDYPMNNKKGCIRNHRL